MNSNLIQNDIKLETLVIAQNNHDLIPLDTETSGLDWRTEKLEIVQAVIGNKPIIVQDLVAKPQNLITLLEDGNTRKVFHYAMFDLRFMAHNWNARPRNIICTKIMSKILNPEEGASHSLGYLLEHHLGIKINKDQEVRVSDWGRQDLSEEQLSYAAGDVIYLPQLAEVLLDKLDKKGLRELAESTFAHIPARLELELLGYEDVFTY